MSERLAKLYRSLAHRLGDPALSIEPFSQGVDTFVDLVRRPAHPTAVVKSTKFGQLHTTYDGLVDLGDVLKKEVVVARLLTEAHLPVPAVLAWHRSQDFDQEPSWILSEYIAHESRATLPRSAQTQLGRLTRAIHAIRPDKADLRTLAPFLDWDGWVVDRIVARIASARRYVPLPETRHIINPLRRMVAGRSQYANSLLHLDLRAANIAVVKGTIVALFDFGNAIVGDPHFELARIRTSGGLTPAFLRGYGLSISDLQDGLLRAYGLDLSTLLVIVTKEEFEDQSLHVEMAERTLSTMEWLASR